MKRLIMRAIAAPVVLGMTVAGIAAAAPASFADGPSLGSRMGTPSQTTNDQAATSTTQGLWGDMPGGVANARTSRKCLWTTAPVAPRR